MKVAGAILAAGTSSRMGQNKLLMEFKHHTVIEETLSQLLNSNVDDIVVVTGFESARVEKLVSRHQTTRTRIVYNENYRLGRAESVKCAIRGIGQNADAVLFMVADKPGVTSELINRVIDRFNDDRPLILYVKTPSGRGHPIIFSKEISGELLSLNGDLIGDDLIARHQDDVIELEDGAVQVDIDTEQDYKMLIKSMCAGEDQVG